MSEGAANAVAKMKPPGGSAATYRTMHYLWHAAADPASHVLRPWTVWTLNTLGPGPLRERAMKVRGVLREQTPFNVL